MTRGRHAEGQGTPVLAQSSLEGLGERGITLLGTSPSFLILGRAPSPVAGLSLPRVNSAARVTA